MEIFNRKKSTSELKHELRFNKISNLMDKILGSDVEIHTVPLSDEYFILDKPKQIFVMVNNSSIKVSSPETRYEISISGNESLKLSKKILKKMQDKVDNLKKGMFSNEIKLLNSINLIYASQEENELALQNKKYQDLVKENDKAIANLINK